jgi:methyltransferase (TIGR00027 family)
MRGDLPSVTAMGVALLRGIATEPGSPFVVDDPIARQLLPWPLRHLPRLVRRMPLASRVLSGGLLDHVALRTAAIDAALASLPAIRQLAILGAGLDARAYRMRELGGTVVFEVDHPSTQRMKRAKLAGRAPLAREVRFVAVDFAKGSLEEELERAGHDRSRPTVWLWEGVLPYLDRAAARATLGVIDRRSAPGSTLLATYVTADLVSAPPAIRPVLRRAFATLGEPLSLVLSPEEMRDLAAEVKFERVSDTGSPDWARSHLRRGRGPLLEITERLLVAKR